jgi:CheY-like chemotaxis protein
VRRKAPDLPIVAMSGLPEQSPETPAAGAGANAFLAKPFTSHQLLLTLKTALANPVTS